MKYNFDKTVNRRNTNSYKWDVEENELPMWVADMDFETAPCVKEAVIKKAMLGAYGYTYVPSEFYTSISKWYERRHHATLNSDYMIYSAGIVAAISSMVKKLTTPAENVVIMAPVYNCFYSSILNAGRNVLETNLIYENGIYRIDWVDFEEKLKNPQTSLFILCNPHNPTGNIWTKEELARIGELCNKYQVICISDEIHCEFVEKGYEYTTFSSVSKLCEENSITCISGSKTFNIAGLQGACLYIPNPTLRHRVWRGINTDEVGEPNFFAVEASIAAYTDGDLWVDDLVDYITNNRNYFTSFVKENIPSLHVVESHASYLAWVDISKVSNDSTLFTSLLRKETGLYINSGKTYGEAGKTFVRINLGTSLENVKEGLRRLKDYVDGAKK